MRTRLRRSPWPSCCVSASCSLLLAWPAAAQDKKEVDLALAMAIDISGSIDPDEAKLQREGYVHGLPRPGDRQGDPGRRQRPHRRRLLRMVRRLGAAAADRLDPARLARRRSRPSPTAWPDRADLDRAPHLDQRRHPLRHPAVRPQPLRGRAQGARHLGRRLRTTTAGWSPTCATRR